MKCKAIPIHVSDNKRTIYLRVKRAAVKTSAFLNRGFFQVSSNIIHKHIRTEHLFFEIYQIIPVVIIYYF